MLRMISAITKNSAQMYPSWRGKRILLILNGICSCSETLCLLFTLQKPWFEWLSWKLSDHWGQEHHSNDGLATKLCEDNEWNQPIRGQFPWRRSNSLILLIDLLIAFSSPMAYSLLNFIVQRPCHVKNQSQFEWKRLVVTLQCLVWLNFPASNCIGTQHVLRFPRYIRDWWYQALRQLNKSPTDYSVLWFLNWKKWFLDTVSRSLRRLLFFSRYTCGTPSPSPPGNRLSRQVLDKNILAFLVGKGDLSKRPWFLWAFLITNCSAQSLYSGLHCSRSSPKLAIQSRNPYRGVVVLRREHASLFALHDRCLCRSDIVSSTARYVENLQVFVFSARLPVKGSSVNATAHPPQRSVSQPALWPGRYGYQSTWSRGWNQPSDSHSDDEVPAINCLLPGSMHDR